MGAKTQVLSAFSHACEILGFGQFTGGADDVQPPSYRTLRRRVPIFATGAGLAAVRRPVRNEVPALKFETGTGTFRGHPATTSPAGICSPSRG